MKGRRQVAGWLLLVFLAFPFVGRSQEAALGGEELEFLREREKAAFKGMEALVDPATGLPVDIAAVTEEGLSVHDAKTSPTNIGLWIAAIIAGRDLGLIPWEEAERRLERAVTTLERMEKYRGLFYNWYNLAELTEEGAPVVGAPTVGPEAQRFISSVDNANLTAALMVAAGALPEGKLKERMAKLLEAQDYGIFCRLDWLGRPRMNHGYWPNRGELSPFDYGIFMTEARLLVFLAIVKGDIPDLGLLGYMDAPLAFCEKSTGEGVVVVASWGGSLFEELFPDLFLDEKGNAPDTLAENHRRVVGVHIDRADPETGLWGWSPGEDVEGVYRAAGVPCLGSGGNYPMGDVTPYSILLAARYAPGEAVETLHRMEELNPEVYDPGFGYRDSISKDGTRIAPHVLSLDKGMEALALFNFIEELEGRAGLWRYFWAYLEETGRAELGHRLLEEIEFDEPFYRFEAVPEAEGGMRLVIPEGFVGPAGGCAVGGGAGGRMNGTTWRWVPCEALRLGLRYDVTPPHSFAYFTVIALGEGETRLARDLSPFRRLTVRAKSPISFKVEFKRAGSFLHTAIVPASPEWHTHSFPFPGFLVGEVDEITIAVAHDQAAEGEPLVGVIHIEEIALSG